MTPAAISDLRLMSLAEASDAIGVSVGDLRTAMRHKQLTPVRIGRKLFVTESDLRAMITACRAAPKDHDCGSGQEPAAPRHGSSSTEERSIAQAAALATAKALSKRSPITSAPSTSRVRREVVSLKS